MVGKRPASPSSTTQETKRRSVRAKPKTATKTIPKKPKAVKTVPEKNAKAEPKPNLKDKKMLTQVKKDPTKMNKISEKERYQNALERALSYNLGTPHRYISKFYKCLRDEKNIRNDMKLAQSKPNPKPTTKMDMSA